MNSPFCRVFAIDLRHCPRWGGTVRVIAAINDPVLIARILQHRGARDDFIAEAPIGVAHSTCHGG